MCIFDVFFFFKQKTAYEMRISDWSSDVCSSDLETIQAQSKREIMSVLVHLTQSEIRALVRRAAHAKGRYLATLMELPRSLSSRRTAVDRKSVLSGKSVSVRVDLGGTRIIKHKTRITYSISVNTYKNTISS